MTYGMFKSYLQAHGRLEIGDKLPRHVKPLSLTCDCKSGIVELLGVGKLYFNCDYDTPCNVTIEYMHNLQREVAQ